MFCWKCGKELAENAKACYSCDSKVYTDETAGSKSFSENTTDHPQSHVSEAVPEKTDAAQPENKVKLKAKNRGRTFDTEYLKCPSCGRVTHQYGVYYCPKCNVRYVKYDTAADATKRKNESEKNRKKWFVVLIILAVFLSVFVGRKIIGSKTIESGNGWKHQVGDFGHCGMYDCKEPATHRFCVSNIKSCYCEEHWNSYGQDMLNRMAKQEGKSKSFGREKDAKICAVDIVKQNLKSPSTAKFCKYNEMSATNLGGDKWKVTGYVDAQNSFGATLRENWTVTLKLTIEGYTEGIVTFN